MNWFLTVLVVFAGQSFAKTILTKNLKCQKLLNCHVFFMKIMAKFAGFNHNLPDQKH